MENKQETMDFIGDVFLIKQPVGLPFRAAMPDVGMVKFKQMGKFITSLFDQNSEPLVEPVIKDESSPPDDKTVPILQSLEPQHLSVISDFITKSKVVGIVPFEGPDGPVIAFYNRLFTSRAIVNYIEHMTGVVLDPNLVVNGEPKRFMSYVGLGFIPKSANEYMPKMTNWPAHYTQSDKYDSILKPGNIHYREMIALLATIGPLMFPVNVISQTVNGNKYYYLILTRPSKTASPKMVGAFGHLSRDWVYEGIKPDKLLAVLKMEPTDFYQVLTSSINNIEGRSVLGKVFATSKFNEMLTMGIVGVDDAPKLNWSNNIALETSGVLRMQVTAYEQNAWADALKIFSFASTMISAATSNAYVNSMMDVTALALQNLVPNSGVVFTNYFGSLDDSYKRRIYAPSLV